MPINIFAAIAIAIDIDFFCLFAKPRACGGEGWAMRLNLLLDAS